MYYSMRIFLFLCVKVKMYKTKLQELCHKRKWGLPRYSALKDGPDHIPSFKASVHVNGVIFTSSSASSSLKEAKNKAAMVAFLSFCSGSSTQTSEQDTKEQIRAVKPQGSSIPAQSSVIIDDMDCIHKIQLQNNARMNNLDSPVFACKTEELPPVNDFKATLLVDGHCIESPSVANTIKETERASDLMSLSPDIFEKGDSDSFKTSIMKLTEKEGFHKPTYKTMQAGCPYMPTFFSTLEVEGVEFHGKGCRSKREAEEDAAKIAYIALKKLKMYKTKLQELCHKREWGLPRYSAMKDGPDHIPSFKASVHVHGVIFTSSGASSSLKEAKNKAAMVAFLSFCSGSSTQTSEQDTKEQIREVKPQGSSIPAQSSVVIDDMDCIHKIQLQNNARMNNLDSPVFACKTEELPPANDFKATLLVDGHSIDSPSVANTIKETERASDLMSLSPDIFEKGDSDSFKTSIMKLTEKEGFHKPTYKTMQAGCPYMPTFFSTLEVEGVEFHGKGCRSKREAEEDAAKIAYIAIKKCGLSMYAVFLPSPIEHKAVQSILSSDIVKCIQNLKLEDLNDTLYENVKVANEEEQKSSFLQSPDK